MLNHKKHIQEQIFFHVQKILMLQDEEGKISSYLKINRKEKKSERDLPRQAMATMALSYSNFLSPDKTTGFAIEKSLLFIEKNLLEEDNPKKYTIYLYLALAEIYTKKNPKKYIDLFMDVVASDFFQNPIAVNLYIRLSYLLSEPLPHTKYLIEYVRYHICLIPRKHRFFDYADILVWGKEDEQKLACKEFNFLMKHKNTDRWFSDLQSKVPSTSSVVGKIFEVLCYYCDDQTQPDEIYIELMKRTLHSEYALNTAGRYKEHIFSEPNTLNIDDVHTHILIGLCYLYEKNN